MDDTQKMTILVVDDNPDNLKIIGNFLRREGYSVRLAQNGPLAIESARLEPPDLILLDVAMPGMDGYSTCRALTQMENLKDIPIIFITAERKGTVNMLEGFQAGGVDYIEKPVESAIIAARVRLHLRLLQARRQLEERNKELEEINQWKTILISTLGHDLRNPVSGFLSITGAILKDYDSFTKESLLEYLVELHKAAKNTSAILENILAWASLSNKQEAQMEEFDLMPLLWEVKQEVETMASAKGITLEVNEFPEIHVYADFEMTHTILRNLVTNAIKFTPQNGKVWIETFQDPITSLTTVKVSDTGCGMTSEQLQKLFTREIKSKVGTSGERGSGLGLLICNELAKRQYCTLWARSELGKGSEFYLRFEKKL